jgi:hypothetical protein
MFSESRILEEHAQDGRGISRALCASKLTKLFICLPIVFASAAGAAMHFDGDSWWKYVQVLADDSMEGRDTGSPGLERAQKYVVTQLRAAGLTPAGTNGFYQPVRFESHELDEKASSAALVTNGVRTPLVLGEDGFYVSRLNLAPSIEAPLVFVGYGLQIPDLHYDDLAGLDLHGKIAVFFNATPAGIPSEVGAHSRSTGVRWATFRNAGAIGAISIPAQMDIPWPRVAANRNHPTMVLAGAAFDETRGMQVYFVVNPAHVEKLFAGSEHSFADILALAQAQKPLPHFTLAAGFAGKTKLIRKSLTSANLVAKLEGTDATLKSEDVVLSAHLDHVGIGEAVNGDKIFNGAMDNASGCAVLMDVAAALHKSGVRPKRSLLFVFVTGEEKGDLGSEYFAEKPTVDGKSIVADINIDMFLPIVPLKTLNVYGLNESTLGDTLADVAHLAGVGVQADPQPQRSVFTRSDQYSFVKQGIPGIMFDVAFLGAEQEKIGADWLSNRYHAPSDDLQQPIDKETAAKYEEIVGAFTMAVADDAQRPTWKAGSFFRRFVK